MKLEDFEFEKLISLYGVVNEICQDYSRMTDGYSLATGDEMFESMPEDIKEMIKERQVFFSYRNRIKKILKDSIVKIMKDVED